MSRTHTYTLASMCVPKAVWDLIRKQLEEAGYQHAIDERDNSLDMTGIALVPGEDEEPAAEEVYRSAMKTAADSIIAARRERNAAIAECRADHGGVWPEDLTSGVMFFRGYKIHRDEFTHSKLDPFERGVGLSDIEAGCELQGTRGLYPTR